MSQTNANVPMSRADALRAELDPRWPAVADQPARLIQCSIRSGAAFADRLMGRAPVTYRAPVSPATATPGPDGRW